MRGDECTLSHRSTQTLSFIPVRVDLLRSMQFFCSVFVAGEKGGERALSAASDGCHCQKIPRVCGSVQTPTKRMSYCLRTRSRMTSSWQNSCLASVWSERGWTGVDEQGHVATQGSGSVEKLPVIVVDDHSVVREGLAGLIDAEPDLRVVAAAATGTAAIACVASAPAGVVVLDLDLPDMTGFEVLHHLTVRYPKLRVLIFSSFPSNVFSSKALDAGAAGYLSKQSGASSIVPALRAMIPEWGSWCEMA